jgi:hypothetical protein
MIGLRKFGEPSSDGSPLCEHQERMGREALYQALCCAASKAPQTGLTPYSTFSSFVLSRVFVWNMQITFAATTQ